MGMNRSIFEEKGVPEKGSLRTSMTLDFDKRRNLKKGLKLMQSLMKHSRLKGALYVIKEAGIDGTPVFEMYEKYRAFLLKSLLSVSL